MQQPWNLAPVLANQSLDDLPERWRGHSAYWVARHLLELEVVRRESAKAPPQPGAKAAAAKTTPSGGVVLDFGDEASSAGSTADSDKEGEDTPAPPKPKPPQQASAEPPPDLNRARSLLRGSRQSTPFVRSVSYFGGYDCDGRR